MSTPVSDINHAIHFLSRAKMCTFSQCEPVAVITGSASEQDSEYAMQVKASGQVEVLEWVLRVRPEGVTVKEKIVKIDLYAGSSNSIVVI